MTTAIYIIIAIIVFGILIAVHELGHFIAAKSLGVKVNEFSIGMGPAILKRQKGETLYALRALPIGGYCAMEGEDELSEDKRSFTSAKAWKRLIILVAGSFMNFLIGFIIVAILFSSATAFYTTTIRDFNDEEVEQQSRLQEGDKILEIDGENIYIASDISTFLSRAGSDRIDITVLRDGERVELHDIELTYADFYGGVNLDITRATLGQKLKMSWYNSIGFVRLVRISLMDLFRGDVSVSDLSGPIGIVDVMTEMGTSAESVEIAVENIAYLTAFIAINLAVMNMLPIPALDGGRVFFLIVTTIVEKIRRKRIDPKYEGYIHMAGLFFFLGLMVFVAFNDIVKIIGS